MNEYIVFTPDGHYGYVWTDTYQSADEIARDYMTIWGDYLVIIPTGRHCS